MENASLGAGLLQSSKKKFLECMEMNAKVRQADRDLQGMCTVMELLSMAW